MDRHNSAHQPVDDPEIEAYYKRRGVLYQKMAKEQPKTEDIMEYFQNEAAAYDKYFDKIGFRYIPAIVDAVKSLVKDREAKILDIAAGSGKIGIKLRECGYTEIDAVDGSTAMLDIAREKDVYNKYICCLVGSEKMPSVPDCTYDIVCCGAGVARAHIPVEAIPTMLRAAKPNGYLIFNHQDWSGQFEDFSEEAFEACFERMRRNGLCSSVEKRPFLYRPGEPSRLFVLQRGEDTQK